MLKYLSSDSKNIKKSLYHITNYINNKSIDQNKANNVSGLKGIGKVAWNFISAFYKLGWDLFIFDKNNWTFKQNIMVKFTPKIQEIKTNNKSNKKNR